MVPNRSVICVVDDDEEVRDSISAFFHSAGIVVEIFDSAEALLNWPRLDAMACLITDLHMPGMDGLDLQRTLAARKRTVPVILMTAYPTPAAREAAQVLGISSFISKPVDPDALLEKVEALLALNRPDG
jgi:FixJ family two-component response regulator